MSPAEKIRSRPRVAELLDGVAGLDWNGDAAPLAGDVPGDAAGFLALAEQMARIVADVHARGVTHRDIRPENFRRRDSHPVLAGFDRAVTFDTESEGFETLQHLPADVSFIAPEQTGRINRPVGPRADLYSLGGTFYALATGQAPFSAESRSALLHAHLAADPRDPRELAPWMPRALSRIILRLLSKEPDERYQGADGLVEDLRFLRAAAERNQAPDNLSADNADRVTRPRRPQRQHGRDTEIRELLAALDSVTRGGKQCVFIGGEAGVGKTSLVGELQRPAALRAGRFVRGKCEQFQREQPLLAPLQALRQLIRLLAGEEEETLRALKSRLAGDLGPEAGVLHDLLPELALVAEKSFAPLAPDPREGQARLNAWLVRLIRAIASPAHPLVLVLDDLQWADRPTLDFIGALMEEEDIAGLLLVGLFRSNEIESAPALRRLMEKPPGAKHEALSLQLMNLPAGDLDGLVGEMLGTKPEAVRELAAAMHRATRGNPFYAVEMVDSIHREGLLVFDRNAQRWTWDSDALARRAPSQDTVEFLTRSLTDLPPATGDILSTTALLGADVTLGILVQATGREANELISALLPALEQGVIITADAEKLMKGEAAARLSFRHDRLQQAAAALRDETWRKSRHLSMARRLAADAADPAAIFRVAEQYAEAHALLEEPQEKENVAALFLAAGRRARQAGALATARRFLRLALELLAPDPWHYAPALSWNLHEELHLVCYSLPEYEEADAIYAQLRERAQNAEIMAAPTAIQVMSLSNRTRYEEAVRLGAALLGELGIAVPMENADKEVEQALGELYRSIESGVLERLPTSGEATAEAHAAARLLNRMVPAAFFFRPAVANWLVIHAARIWTGGSYGDARIYPMACLPLVTIAARGDHATGYRAARAALAVGEKAERGVETARARHVFGLFGCHWREPLENAIAQAEEARDALLRSGELEFACYTFFTSQAALLDTGDTLGSLAAENQRALAFSRKTGNRHGEESYEAFRGLIDALSAESGSAAPQVPSSNPMAACYHHMTRALAACLLDDQEAHTQHAESAARLAPYITGFYPTALINVLESLALIARLRSGHGGTGLMERVAANQQWLAARAADAPQNFAHLHDLVEAERLSAAGRGTEALPLYERAIRRAKAHRRPWNAALAAEKAARCYLALELEEAGRRVLEEARSLYAAWGATRKCTALEAEFPFLRSVRGWREMQPLLAATQQLAFIRSVPRLAETTAEIVRELSGATDVQILALDERDRWMLEAGYAGGEQLSRQTAEEAEHSGLVSAAVFRSGIRLKEPLLSEDAAADTRFAADPRFRGADRCALLGVPVISRNRVVAFVILENRKLRGAFGAEMADMVGMLCGQLGVSIENARIHNSLEEEVKARTQELHAAREKAADSARSLQRVLDNLPIAVAATTLTSPADITFINEQFTRTFGYKSEDVPTFAVWAEKAYPDPKYRCEMIREWDQAVFRAIETKGTVESMEFEVTCKDGTKREIIFRAVVLDDSLLTSMTDVTARRRAEQKLSEAHRNMQLAASAARLGFWELDVSTGLDHWDEEMARINGIVLADFDGHWEAFVHPDDHEEVMRETQRMLESDRIFGMEYRIRRPNGEVRHVRERGIVTRDIQGRAIRVNGVLQDITEEKESAEKLRQAAQSMQLAAAAAGIGFWSRDDVHAIEEWDDQMLKIYGVTREEFDGNWEAFVHPEDLPKIQELTKTTMREGKTGHYEFRIIRPDGKIRHVRGLSTAILGTGDEPAREIGVDFDITEEKSAVAREKQLEENHRRDLENKLRTSLTAAAVAHEINQPLSAILLRSKMALEEKGDGLQALAEVASEAKRVVATIEKMKTLMRNVQTEHRAINLGAVVRSALLYNKTMLSRHKVKVRESGLKKVHTIMGDDEQLQLAITNILRNAAEALDQSASARREIAVDLTADDKEVILTIGDSGPGWSGAEQAETPLTTTKKGGTGIGLYVARTAMENHRGKLIFGKSALGGAEVKMIFPRDSAGS